MQRIALVNPRSPFLVQENVMPPLGLWSVGASLRANGYRVDYFDMACGDELPLATVKDYLAVGVTGTTPQADEMAQIAKALNDAGAKWLIAGGPHASLEPQEVLAMGYKTVLKGEGEYAVLDILREKLEGYVEATRLYELDDLPWPDRTQAARYEYLIDGLRATTVFSTRGCPSKCSFCCREMYGNRCTFRSAENVIAEVKELRDVYGFGAAMFFDDTFTLRPKRLVQICHGLKDLGVKWRCFVRTDTVTWPILKLMKDSGCVEVGVGIESGSQKILDNVHKGTTVEQNNVFMHNARTVGIRTKCFLILGLPGESHETVAETRRWLASQKPDNFDVTIYTPYPHTEIVDYPERFDIQIKPDSYSHLFFKGKPGEYSCNVSTSELSAEDIIAYRDEMEQTFRRQ